MNHDITFGTDGNSFRYQLSGWSAAEKNFTWTGKSSSHLLLPGAVRNGPYLLELHVAPFSHDGAVSSRRLETRVNGVQVGASEVVRQARLAYIVADKIVRPREPVRLTFSFPDAAKPADMLDSCAHPALTFSLSRLRLTTLPNNLIANVRRMAPMLDHGLRVENDAPESYPAPSPHLLQKVREQTGLDASDLMLNFESLGQSCEFGLLQRRCGAEPLGLFRFSSTFLDHLQRGIDCGFVGLGESDSIAIHLTTHPTNPEFYVTEENYELLYHTYVYAGEATADGVKVQQTRKLQFLKRKFLEDLQDGRKIFVRTCRREFNATEEMIPLFMALNRDRANTLLWVVYADETHPAGSVERIATGLFIGYIDTFAPEADASNLSVDVWLSICANAYVLLLEQRSRAESS